MHEGEGRNKFGRLCNWHACIKVTIWAYLGFPGNVQKPPLPPKAFEFFGIKRCRGGNVHRTSGVCTGRLKGGKDGATLPQGPLQMPLCWSNRACKCSRSRVSPGATGIKTTAASPHNQTVVAFSFPSFSLQLNLRLCSRPASTHTIA